MVTTIPLTQARIRLGELVKRAHIGKEHFILEKDGYPVAGIIDFEELEDYLELNDPKINTEIQRSRMEYSAGRGKPASELITKLEKKIGNRRSR